MEIIRSKSYEEVSKEAAKIITKIVKDNPKAILGLATGSTPLGLYGELIKEFNEGILDFSEVRTFNLDEYIGLSANHQQSYRSFMENNLFKHINLKDENCQVPSGIESDYDAYCQEYEKMVDSAGGMDVLILGVGENGHIAFNEPNTRLGTATHIVDLTDDTIKVNSRFFRSVDEVPRQAITMGMGTIMKAKKIVLLLTGKNKAHVLNRLLKEKYITAEFPVSFLKMHRDVTVIFDEEACSEI